MRLFSYRSMFADGKRIHLGIGFMDKERGIADLYNYKIEHYALVYVLKGGGSFVDENGKTFAVLAGDFFQRLPFTRHQFYTSANEDYRECFLTVSKSIMDFLESMRIIKTRPNIRHVGINESMVSKMNDAYLEHNSATNDMLPSILLRFVNLFAEFHQMADSNERPENNGDLVKMACEYLSSDFAKHKSLQDFCFVHRIGYERFRKIFREDIGVSPHSYYIQKRIDAAINLLSRHDQTIGEIALKLGFSSRFEFSTQFKKYVGCSPTNFTGNL